MLRERSSSHNLNRSAFTLIETVVAIGVMSIILVGAGAAITMTVSAADRSSDGNTRFTDAADVLDRMSADVQSAIDVPERSSTAITIVVPDRNNDGQPETIRYTWTGSSGGPLLRYVNNAVASKMLLGVESFTMTPMFQAGKASTMGVEGELIGYTSSLGATNKSVTITDKYPVAQYFKPAFGRSVTAWKITRVKVMVMRDSTPTGTLRVSIVESQNWNPTGAILATVDIPEAALPASFTEIEIALPTGSISPRQGVLLKLESVGSEANRPAATIQYDMNGTAMPYNTFFTWGMNWGAEWSGPQDTSDLRFVAYGTITTTP